jgi:hypothetical protein
MGEQRNDQDHENLAEAIFDAVRALPLSVGLRGLHALAWEDLRFSPGEAERYRKAADAAFELLGRRLPPRRHAALLRAQGGRVRPPLAKRVGEAER